MRRDNLLITLASASPRRRNLLAQIGIDAIVAPTNALEESISIASLQEEGLTPDDACRRLPLERALLKARHARACPGTLGLLAADTVVIADAASLEKPADADEAGRMMRLLAGREHQVHTAVVFRGADAGSAGDAEAQIVTTRVRFLELDDREIDQYVESGEWQGVAGGYRIQGRAGAFVDHIDGSYTAVMGLPTGTVYSMIRRFLSVTAG